MMKKLRGILLSMTAVIVLLSLGGCGTKVNTKSPEKITKSLIEAYTKTDEDAVKKCFGMDKKDKVSSELKTEIKHYMTLFEAYDAKSVKFTKCESLGSFNGYELMYAIYTLKKEDSESKTTLEIPCLSVYYVQNNNKKYSIVQAKDVTEEMSENSKKEFQKFMKTDEYKTYEKDYKQFTRKNPSYEEELTNLLEQTET
ncbi:MAG: hypothetical protein U0I31_05860 [Blautia stercoris]|jgi:hypothetical protein|uniref:hypothetical protein n=2 Tax=Blautia stercoris TaxID=871664 RepID=UPI002EBCCA55|nr:hypothetical protein [Blautia stercoris]